MERTSFQVLSSNNIQLFKVISNLIPTHHILYLHILMQGEKAVPTPSAFTTVAQYGKYGLPMVVQDLTAASLLL
jgi:hypothetical protein